MPAAEYLDKDAEIRIQNYIDYIKKEIESFEIKLQYFGKDEVYHGLNDLCGTMVKYVEEAGYFHQILEEDF